LPPLLFEVADLRIAVYDGERRSNGPTTDGNGDALPDGWVVVVPGMTFSVRAGETLALVGESASGKSLTLLGAVGLLPQGARVVGGSAEVAGVEVPFPHRSIAAEKGWLRRRFGRFFPELEDDEWRRTIGTKVGIMFQDPIAAWDPTMMIGEQSGEVLEEHQGLPPEEVRRRVLDALGEVRLPRERKFLSFAREMSRGEAQRAMLAAALLSHPRLLLADEPLSGLDPPAAHAVLRLIDDMCRLRGMGMVLVTHDLAVVASVADRVAVVYGGRIVEIGSVHDIFHDPQHPYTSGLLRSIPWQGLDRLEPIAGEPPHLLDLPPGCAFAPRCVHAIDACTAAVPGLVPSGPSRAACIRSDHLDLPGIPGR
jgi:oligopeptide/dipeptide ABC transporter ATP-binding protein